VSTTTFQTLPRPDYEFQRPAQHPIAISQEAQQLCCVSRRLDLLVAQQPLVSEAIISIAESVRNIATLLEMLVATKMSPISGLGADWHGEDKPKGTTAAEHKAIGYGLPCSKCHAYYPADLTTCPICQSPERVSPIAVTTLQVGPRIVTPNTETSTFVTSSSNAWPGRESC
jgi:hypothetical protein